MLTPANESDPNHNVALPRTAGTLLGKALVLVGGLGLFVIPAAVGLGRLGVGEGLLFFILGSGLVHAIGLLCGMDKKHQQLTPDVKGWAIYMMLVACTIIAVMIADLLSHANPTLTQSMWDLTIGLFMPGYVYRFAYARGENAALKRLKPSRTENAD